MNIQEKLNQLNKEKNELENKYSQLKSEYHQYITDKKFPLMTRWEFFISAPSEMKEQSRWIIRGKTGFLSYVLDNWFDAPEVYGRGKQIYIDTLFEELIYEGKINLEGFDLDQFDEEDVELALEELLQMNLEYFTFDW